MAHLVPCSSCHRHVLASEAACPFCDATLSNALRQQRRPASPPGLKRAALFALGTSLTAGIACGSDDGGGGTGEVGQNQNQGVPSAGASAENPAPGSGPGTGEGLDDGNDADDDGSPEADDTEGPGPTHGDPDDPDLPVRPNPPNLGPIQTPAPDDGIAQPLYGAPAFPEPDAPPSYTPPLPGPAGPAGPPGPAGPSGPGVQPPSPGNPGAAGSGSVGDDDADDDEPVEDLDAGAAEVDGGSGEDTESDDDVIDIGDDDGPIAQPVYGAVSAPFDR